MSTTDGLVIPVSTPGADKAAEDLGRVAAATAQVGQGAQEMGASVARGGSASTQALASIGASAARSESHLAELRVTGNQALQELGQKGAEFARSIGGAGGAVAELGVKILATAGPYGAMAAAGVGAIGMIVSALNEHQASLERDRAVTSALAASTQDLGAAYPSVAAAVNAATTAQGAYTAAARANMDILQQQISLVGQGMTGAEAGSFTLSLQRISEASLDATTGLATLSPAMIQHAALAGNAAEQELVLGTNIERSTNQYVERANVVTRLAAAERNRLAQRVQELEAQRQAILNDTNSTAISKLQQLRSNETALATARGQLTTATNSLTTATDAGNAATREQLAHQRDLLRLADAERARLDDKAEAEKRATSALAAHTAAVNGHAEAVARAQARMASQAGARAMVDAMENEAIERRIAGNQALVAAGNDASVAAARAADQAHEAAMQAVSDAVQLDADQRAIAAMEDANLRQRLESRRHYGANLRELLGAEVNAGRTAAEFSKSAFDSMGKALGTHIQALVAGKETVGQALQGMLADTLSALGSEAIMKGAMMFAEGLAALTSPATIALAPGKFAAGAAYMAVGAAASAAGAALAPAPAATGGGGGSPAPAAGGMGTMNTGTQTGGPTNTVINYYAPTFGGREGGIGEVGQQIDRYRRDNTALRRSR